VSFFVLSSVPATSSLLPPDLSSDLLSLPFFICRLHGPTRTSKETSSPSSRISDRVESSERSISSSLRVSKPSFHLPLPLFTNTRTALAIPLSLLPRLSPSKLNFQTHQTDSLPLSPSLHSSLSLPPSSFHPPHQPSTSSKPSLAPRTDPESSSTISC